MSLVRIFARPMLASALLYGGFDAVVHPEPKADVAGDVGPSVASRLPIPLPSDPVALVRINGGVQLAAGLMLSTGRLPRLAALALVASLVPTTYAGHGFWQEKDPAKRKTQRLQFVKNTSILGGLLLAVADTGGRPTLAHLSRDAAHKVGEKVRK